MLIGDSLKEWRKDNILSPLVVTGFIDWDNRSKKFNRVFPIFVKQEGDNWGFYLFGLNTKIHEHNRLVHEYETRYANTRRVLKLNPLRRCFEFCNDQDVLEDLERWEYANSH